MVGTWYLVQVIEFHGLCPFDRPNLIENARKCILIISYLIHSDKGQHGFCNYIAATIVLFVCYLQTFCILIVHSETNGYGSRSSCIKVNVL